MSSLDQPAVHLETLMCKYGIFSLIHSPHQSMNDSTVWSILCFFWKHVLCCWHFFGKGICALVKLWTFFLAMSELA